jgi:hypothetical protein
MGDPVTDVSMCPSQARWVAQSSTRVARPPTTGVAPPLFSATPTPKQFRLSAVLRAFSRTDDADSMCEAFSDFGAIDRGLRGEGTPAPVLLPVGCNSG